MPEIAARLAETYGVAPPPLEDLSARDPLGGLIATLLSQQNTAAITRRQFAALLERFPTWQDALEAGERAVAAALREAGGGLSAVKARYIVSALRRIAADRGELSLDFLRDLPDPEVRAYLENLPGVGMKTASCVMMFDLGRTAMPVDTHIHRIARRLELVPAAASAVHTERWFAEHLEAGWQARYVFHVSAIRHGRQTCRAPRPRCGDCALFELCPSGPLYL
nr:endonuclease III [Deinobacterium chartae]